MELQEFIENSLVSIVKAVIGSNEKLKGTGAIVNPRNVKIRNQENVESRLDDPSLKDPIIRLIKFDVAVLAEDRSESGAAGFISVSIAGVGGKKKSERSKGKESRIIFEIPVLLPSLSSLEDSETKS